MEETQGTTQTNCKYIQEPDDRDTEMKWFVMDETDLSPNEGEWSAANQRQSLC